MDELGYVAEFGWLKGVVRQLVSTLDHRVLVAAECPELKVQEAGENIVVQWRDDHWSFPRGDVVSLPVKNSTAELLAGYIWQQIRDKLDVGRGWQRLTVEVEETPGQRAGITKAIGI
jgi:6-pyruvoyl-tetrahydropterin synthase